jgi:hypothetical protein
MPNDPIPAHVCARMGVPEGSTWGHNAGEIRRMQQNAGMHPFRSSGRERAFFSVVPRILERRESAFQDFCPSERF